MMANISTHISIFIFGCIMANGLILCVMNAPQKILNFFYLNDFGLLYTFMFALIPNLLVAQGLVTTKILIKPLLAENFQYAHTSIVEKDLVVGAALFGLGWSLGGFCPGPSYLYLMNGTFPALISTLSMLFGAFLFRFLQNPKEFQFRSNIFITIFLIIGLWQLSRVLFGESTNYEYVKSDFLSVVGGLILGTGPALYFLFEGRTMGVSGIIGGLMGTHKHETGLRYAFLLSFTLTALAWRYFNPNYVNVDASLSVVRAFVASFLVGFGTSMSGGCTSGHGLCGVSKLSLRSLIATATFFPSALVFANIFRFLGVN